MIFDRYEELIKKDFSFFVQQRKFKMLQQASFFLAVFFFSNSVVDTFLGYFYDLGYLPKEPYSVSLIFITIGFFLLASHFHYKPKVDYSCIFKIEDNKVIIYDIIINKPLLNLYFKNNVLHHESHEAVVFEKALITSTLGRHGLANISVNQNLIDDLINNRYFWDGKEITEKQFLMFKNIKNLN